MTQENKATVVDVAAYAERLVKPLVWADFWKQDEGHRQHAITSQGNEYHVSGEGWWFPLDKLNPCADMDAAKAAAQADYAARILAALDLTLLDRLEACEAALRPFAEAADDLDEHHLDNSPIWESPCAMSIDAGDLRRARSALKDGE